MVDDRCITSSHWTVRVGLSPSSARPVVSSSPFRFAFSFISTPGSCSYSRSRVGCDKLSWCSCHWYCSSRCVGDIVISHTQLIAVRGNVSLSATFVTSEMCMWLSMWMMAVRRNVSSPATVVTVEMRMLSIKFLPIFPSFQLIFVRLVSLATFCFLLGQLAVSCLVELHEVHILTR